jgi:hypothetical protein
MLPEMKVTHEKYFVKRVNNCAVTVYNETRRLASKCLIERSLMKINKVSI